MRRNVGSHRSRVRDETPISPREKAIIETAKSTGHDLPEAYAAARMFFRFDPGFRSELEAARNYCLGSAKPLQVAELSEEQQFDLRNGVRMREVALSLAVRWGLDIDSVVAAIAHDEPPQYPTFVVQPWQVDPITGFRRLEIQVYSSHVWPTLRSALTEIEWLPDGPWLRSNQDIVWFQDNPEGSRKRARGMEGDVAARTLAVHFLYGAPRGRRPTGGSRTWSAAIMLWRSVAAEERPSPSSVQRRTAPNLEDPIPWRRARSRLLRGIFGRTLSAARILAAIRDARSLSDVEWAAELRIDGETWYRILSDQAVDEAVWERIKQAVPEIADDLDTYLEIGLLKTRAY
jgi:hypothetical protein